MTPGPLYDTIGRTYSTTRQGDPRIAAAIRSALGDARSVLNVGAGTGAHEPSDLDVTAVEPSPVMIAQRPPDSAPVVEAFAEDLPFEDGSFDAVMAILSDHHWQDREVGLRELRRVARRRVVLINADPSMAGSFWLTREYLPGFVDLIPARYRAAGAWRDGLRTLLGEASFEVLPIPWDCRYGFYAAFWQRPHAYLDPEVRRNISIFHRLPPKQVAEGLWRLRQDVEGGAWHAAHADLLGSESLDVGMRVVVAEFGCP